MMKVAVVFVAFIVWFCLGYVFGSLRRSTPHINTGDKCGAPTTKPASADSITEEVPE